jgi:uncharacterized protein (UPF0303 family)
MNSDINIDRDLKVIAQQEALLQFSRFDQSMAWTIGLKLKELCEKNSVAVTIEVRLNRETVFFFAMPGTTPSNADWARRKRNTVELVHQSSYAVGLSLKQEQTTLEEKMGLAARDFAAHGGSFPIRIQDMGCVGVVTISGLPQRDDHKYVASVLSDCLDKPLGDHTLL